MVAPALTVQIQGEGEVSADMLNTYEQTCDTFDELRAFIGTAGVQVCARGRDAVNDGYGGEFYWDGSSTGTDDNLDIITPVGATEGRWLRLETPYAAAISAAMQPVVNAATLALARAAMGVVGFLIGPAAGTSVDFGSIATGRSIAGATITVTGASIGDQVIVWSGAAMVDANTFLAGEVTATNTVTPYFQNLSGSTVNPNAMTVYVVVIPKSAYGFI